MNREFKIIYDWSLDRWTVMVRYPMMQPYAHEHCETFEEAVKHIAKFTDGPVLLSVSIE